MRGDIRRGSSAQRGYGSRWQKVRAMYLQANPLCVMCMAEDKLEAATVVDHIIPHRGNMDLMWDESNWQALCQSHHSGAKQREDRVGYAGAVGEDGWPIDQRHPSNRA